GRMLKSFIHRTFHREALFLHGSVSPKARMRMVDKFQAGDAKNPIFILSLKAGGTGLNLTRASHVFHFDRWWNPAVEAQATDRAYRIGQVKNVQVYSFIASRTYEEKIDEMLEDKRDLADRIIKSGEKGLTELSVEEIVDLITLKEERA
ncbi:MAG: SWF/SNF helicase family protein, partial [Spirochaetes bacterium]|nr:SWF/SNF helicase family protein [Spirochaetota bacterium]